VPLPLIHLAVRERRKNETDTGSATTTVKNLCQDAVNRVGTIFLAIAAHFKLLIHKW